MLVLLRLFALVLDHGGPRRGDSRNPRPPPGLFSFLQFLLFLHRPSHDDKAFARRPSLASYNSRAASQLSELDFNRMSAANPGAANR